MTMADVQEVVGRLRIDQPINLDWPADAKAAVIDANLQRYQSAALLKSQARLIERVREVLEPFAAMATAGDQRPKGDAVWAGQDGKRITYGDFRQARALLSELKGDRG